jgi:hypothetical protein
MMNLGFSHLTFYAAVWQISPQVTPQFLKETLGIISVDDAWGVIIL